MKHLNFFIIKLFIVFVTTTKSHKINIDEEISFCDALSSISTLGVLDSPIHIHSIDKNFGNCLKSSDTTYLSNVCINATATISRSSVVIVELAEQLLDINFDCINHDGRHLIAIRNQLNESTVIDLIRVFRNRYLINVTFLIIKNSQILLQTFIPFNAARCNDFELKMINQFDQHQRKWENDQFFPEKLNNFHKCSLIATTHKNVVPYIVREEYINGQRILSGRVIEMINALANSLNFTTALDYHPSVSAYETCLKKVANRESDLFIGNLFLDLNRISYVDFSIPIFFEFLKFVVPPGRSYTQFENLARTFDTQTWSLILFALASSLAIIFLISTRSRDTKIDALGAGYDNAFMDFVADILGMSRMSMPILSIPRLIVIKFVLFTFVIRTLYQGTLFNFLHSNGQLKAAESINEIIGKGYTVYSLTLYDNYFNSSGDKHSSRKFVNLTDFDELLEKISNTNFNGALMHTGSLLMYKNGLKDRNFTNVFCKEDLMTISMVAYLPKNSYLTEVVNGKIGIFHTAGLIDIWDRRAQDTAQVVAKEENRLKEMTVNDLRAIFLIYLTASSVSILTFVWEIYHENLKRKFKSFGIPFFVQC